MYPIFHNVWVICMDVKRPSQKKGLEQLFQRFMYLGQFVLMRGREGEFSSSCLIVSAVTDTVSAREYLHVSEVFQKLASYSEPSYFAVKFLV